MKETEKEDLIEILKRVLQDESKEYKMHYTHHYITKYIKCTYKDYYDIMCAMYEEFQE